MASTLPGMAAGHGRLQLLQSVEHADAADDLYLSGPSFSAPCARCRGMSKSNAPPTRLTPGHASALPHALSQSPGCACLLADGEATEPPVPELEQLDFVGVTELYDESWCLLNWQLDGSLVPDMCTCEYMGRDRPEKQSAARWHGGEVNEAHGTGPHPKADELGKSARELVDLVTASDRVLYSRAVARLLKDLCALDLLCPAQLAALKHRTRHLAGTQTAIDEAASWNCKAVLQLQTNASVVAGFGVREEGNWNLDMHRYSGDIVP